MLSYGRDPRGGVHYELSFTSSPGTPFAFFVQSALYERLRFMMMPQPASFPHKDQHKNNQVGYFSHPSLTNEHLNADDEEMYLSPFEHAR